MQKSTNNLKTIRKSKGFNSLQSLSEASGVPLSTIGAFEKGTRPLNPEHRKKIEEILGEGIVENSTPNNVEEEPSARYSITSTAPWMSSSTHQLEALLDQCVKQKDYGAVGKVADELLNRKIQEKVNGQ